MRKSTKRATATTVKTTVKAVKNQTRANVEKVLKMGKPVNTGKINPTTGYKGVTVKNYPTGTVRFAARIKFEGKNYSKVCKTAVEAAQTYNKMAVKLYGKKTAEKLNILNTVPAVK